ncbi:ATP-binding protein [Pseudoxanthomonas putridarboris]|uniref:ATP-binding protein n=1 Tax=Pseudoxanthomonas putridarboris TaxID=752605 RepID=A0ABU9IW41_9GAMM
MQMRLFIPREHARVDDLNASLEAVLENNGVSRALRCDVRLIVEELASNAIEHGDLAQVGAEEHELCVDIGIRANLLTLEFRESGAPFNPLSLPAPDVEADIMDRPTGGLGVHLVRQLAEETHYQRIGNYNVLRVTLRIPSTESEA